MSDQLALCMVSGELEKRIADARADGTSPCARAVLNLIADGHNPSVSRFRAMSIAVMQSTWRFTGAHVWSDRPIKDAVKELLEVHGVPVGSSRSKTCSGYFLIASPEDIAAAERPIRNEIISLAKRLRTINPKSTFARRLAGQLPIAQGKELAAKGEQI
jgi:hypothetical protein